MNNQIGIKQQFSVLFWSVPKSGFDVARKNTVLNLFKEILENSIDPDSWDPEKMKRFEEVNDGLVIYEEVIETDKKNPDVEKEIMPVIRKKYPGAKFIALRLISA